MSNILKEIIANSSFLKHYGVGHDKGGHSGRYPWGSGKEPYQHSGDFLSRVDQLRKSNFTFTDQYGKTWSGDTAIAKSMGLSTTQFRTQYSLAKDEVRSAEVARAKALRASGHSLNEIAKKMGYANDSSIRSLLNENSEVRMNKARATADILKNLVDEKGMIDVGIGVEKEIGCSREKLEQALEILRVEGGYEVYGGRVDQATNPGKKTTLKVLCPPGTEHKEIYNFENIHSYRDYGNYISYDGGDSFRKSFEYPASLDSKRLQIRYAEEGGINKDGVIELRRGVKDLSLGESHYAQVRIMVDGSHYIKGMAVYSDDMPPGVDVIFNTNKKAGTPKMDVLKEIKDDPDNPFGSLIKEHGGQSYYEDPNGKYINPITGKKESLSLINKRAEEGDWNNWKKGLPSQFLSKQKIELINKQLNLAAADKQSEYEEICSLTNPTVKKAMLSAFAEDCDSAAVHLQAASLPRQQYQVILPLTTIKDNEVYAPNYHNGETVALVRFPHGGTFEIPILKVNNKCPEGKSVITENAKDAIGINSKVAERLSGADFDGDTVLVIPCNSPYSKVHITSTKPLDGLKDFDPKIEYGPESYAGRKVKEMKNTQTEMGKISNLITDMTLKGATEGELERAVRHSMVVIDAEKHHLDYKQSELDNGIKALKRKYQGNYDDNGRYHEGASTLISRAKSETSVEKRKGTPKIDPETGKLIFNSVHEEYIDKNGKTKVRTQQSTKMAETDDAFTLSSGTLEEKSYAVYANKMKELANDARKEILNTGKISYSASAKAAYIKEVESLKAKLDLALLNAPRERQAQVMAKAEVEAKKKAYPDMTRSEISKASNQALANARVRVGAKRTTVDITDKEWEAIQAGAISENILTQILNHTDKDKLRERATPRANNALPPSKISLIKAYSASGHTNDEIAKALGISTSTVIKYLK